MSKVKDINEVLKDLPEMLMKMEDLVKFIRSSGMMPEDESDSEPKDKTGSVLEDEENESMDMMDPDYMNEGSEADDLSPEENEKAHNEAMILILKKKKNEDDPMDMKKKFRMKK